MKRSHWLHFEAGAAAALGKPIVPICYWGLKLTDLPRPYGSMQAIDLTVRSLDALQIPIHHWLNRGKIPPFQGDAQPYRRMRSELKRRRSRVSHKTDASQAEHRRASPTRQGQRLLLEAAAAAKKLASGPVRMDVAHKRAEVHRAVQIMLGTFFSFSIYRAFRNEEELRERTRREPGQRPDGRSHMKEIEAFLATLADNLVADDLRPDVELPRSFASYLRGE
jgi:hypothetical protein